MGARPCSFGGKMTMMAVRQPSVPSRRRSSVGCEVRGSGASKRSADAAGKRGAQVVSGVSISMNSPRSILYYDDSVASIDDMSFCFNVYFNLF
uniref:Uncharacterized protein n=1 Tax=Setaria italica TaxID=4555 RepID=K3ZYH2_SETIT